MLNEAGRLSLILPADQQEKFVGIALENGFTHSRCTKVRTKSDKDPKRVLLEFVYSKNEIELQSKDFVIQADGNGRVYTQEYINLTKDFYLAF